MAFVRKPRYTLEECYSALDIHPKTFRRWLTDANMQPERSRADERIKYLTHEQLEHLARIYGRPWPPQVSEEEHQPELVPAQAYKLLLEQLAEAQQEAQELRASLDTLSTRQEVIQGGLEAQQTRQQQAREQAEQEAIRLITHELQTKQNIEALIAEDIRLREVSEEATRQQQQANERLDAQRQELGTLKARLEQQGQQFAQELGTLQTQAEEQRAMLDEARATIEAQSQRLSDLEARLEQQAQRIDAGEKAQEAAHREQQQAEQRLSAQTREAEQRLHAQVQEAQEAAQRSQEQALAALQRDLLAEVERRMQAREAQHTRENTTLLDIVEKARTAAAVAVQEVEGLQQQLQREQAARTELEQRLKQLQATQASQPSPTTRKQRGGKKTTPGDPQA
ncbi:hypothetical protein [Ktedonobacter racemifer]|uniref:Uncharacterized protein n=1 Tax=Ktedonobacter racemifer DSM 44963 TaxID=485913 RepID=D6U8U0_KTERA|nr:hypothetical protein [Ktedonobacter racemifer]EFH79650.1 hypothetical protein Krac_0128 [Ktedonobacter racemifer DSM 44963]